MKTIVLACLLSWLCVPGVRADLTVVQKVQGQGQDMENTWWFKGAKTRVDTSPATSIIMDLGPARRLTSCTHRKLTSRFPVLP